MEYLETIFHKIAQENNFIFVMGDFNLNLLSYDTHSETNEFLNMMNTQFLLPYILHLTRITDRSTTIIDNIGRYTTMTWTLISYFIQQDISPTN